jgi:preprotein translocase subunit YajC
LYHASLAALAQASATEAIPRSSAWFQLLPFALMAGIFYFLLFAPERKRRKQMAAMLAELKSGDKVVTSGGLHGKIVGVTDDLVHLRIADGIKVEVSKSAVTAVLKEP